MVSNKKAETDIEIRTYLLGGLLPVIDVYFQDRLIQAFYEKSMYGDYEYLRFLAGQLILERHKVKPFNFNFDE